MTTDCVGTIVGSISAFIVGPVIAFIASWQLTLINIGIIPFVILGAKYQAELLLYN